MATALNILISHLAPPPPPKVPSVTGHYHVGYSALFYFRMKLPCGLCMCACVFFFFDANSNSEYEHGRIENREMPAVELWAVEVEVRRCAHPAPALSLLLPAIGACCAWLIFIIIDTQQISREISLLSLAGKRAFWWFWVV
jgi:hypothetical protein